MRGYIGLLVAFSFAACVDTPVETEVESDPSTTDTDDGTEHDAERRKSCGPAGDGETIYGVTRDNKLVKLNSNHPRGGGHAISITGLRYRERVVGIDFRPSDLGMNDVADIGKLYAVTDASRIYIVDPETGAASSPITLKLADGAPVLLSGTAFGVGFNPVPDRLRIHSDTDQNLRINVENGVTVIDGALAYTAGDQNAGADPAVTATGYTNNDADPATGTALFALDSAADVLVKFGPAVEGVSGPNTGKLLTVGCLGIDAGRSTGFDISNATGIAYAVVRDAKRSSLYTIDLATGAATHRGRLHVSALVGIAVAP